MPEYVDATLGASVFSMKLLRGQTDFGTVTYEDEETTNVWADINTQLRRRQGTLRQMTLGIKLQGEDKDDLLQQENDLRAELRKEVNTLAVRPSNATLTTTWTVLRNPAMSAPFDWVYDKANIARCKVVLITEPFGYGDPEELYNQASYESPTMVDLPNLQGQADPPLSVTVQRAWSDEGIGIQHVILALCPVETTFEELSYELAAGSGWDTIGGSSDAHGGSFARHDEETAWNHLDVDVGAAPMGRYRVFVRAKTSDTGDAYIAKRKQTSSDRDPKTRQKLTTVWQWYDLGEYIPYNGVGDLRIFAYPGAGQLGLDYLVLVPVDWYWMRYEDPTQLTHAVRFGWLYDQHYNTTADATWHDATARINGHGLKCDVAGMNLLVLVEQTDGNDPTPDYLLSVGYTPRWENFR
jgi:hypothetical protein